jgi:hypothetical protein
LHKDFFVSQNFGFENACLTIRMSPAHRFHIPQGPCAQSALKKQEQNYTLAFKSRFMLTGQECIQPLIGQYKFFIKCARKRIAQKLILNFVAVIHKKNVNNNRKKNNQDFSVISISISIRMREE